ncbi:hypothetical protein BU23DRAFT_645754 [Bimuria novae-zelandiae CBS 107.79]|uniref:DUF1446-domain-containing protein n=1 Tax=Bimuria novae-zelandiae CBS 107.79 TaxID=1447943 RepID=A0A6A5V473_9PLEO|nr:hypothetical protein BU23DRAFT_645754 [Bimuria novae-zelandiae CBS 107.79]
MDGKSARTPVCNIVTPVGMLGFGLDESITAELLAAVVPNGAPTAIILDSGSTDSGPEKLALGCMNAPRYSYVRDLTKLLRLAWKFGVPLIFSSAGGDGSDEHVEEMLEILQEICNDATNHHYSLKTIAIFSSVTKSFVHHRLHSNAITGCGPPVPPLTPQLIDSAPRILSQMGPEPIYDALTAHPDFTVLVAGRAYDPSPYIAFAAYASKTPFPTTSGPKNAAKRLWGGFAHMGKILECGGLCATPKCAAVRATVYEDGTFDLTPGEPRSRCTPLSVSAHTLYEKSRPDVLYGPGGWLNLTQSRYEQLDDGRTCRVIGGEFTFSRDEGRKYQVKLEAARVVGYRASYEGCVKDPVLIRQLDEVLEKVRAYVKQQHEGVEGNWELDWHRYGQHQVTAEDQPAEVFLIGEALADTQELANSVASTARKVTVHIPYPEQKATSGNFAYGLGGKMESELGPCAEFSIYHLVELEEGEERLNMDDNSNALYRQKVSVIGRGAPQKPQSLEAPQPSETVQPRKIPLTLLASTVDTQYPTHPKTLGDITRVLRSKNAGPYEITFDVMFSTARIYQLVKSSNLLSAAVIARLHDMREDEVIWSGFFDQALAWKATIPRTRRGQPVPAGGFMESDVHGSQKYIRLLNLPLPRKFVEKWDGVVARGMARVGSSLL